MSSLTVLGLSEHDEHVYLRLLSTGEVHPGDALGDLGLSQQDATEALDRLSGLRLLRRLPCGSLAVVPPATSIGRLIELRMDELNSELREVAAVRAVIPRLERFRCDVPSSASSEVELLTTLSDVRARIEDLAFFAREEVLSLQPDGPLTRENIAAAYPLDLRLLRRRVSLRTLVLHSALQDPDTRQYIRDIVLSGAQFRCVERPLERMLIFDRATALVPVSPGASASGALLVRQPGLVTNMVELFERVWSGAAPADPYLDLPSASDHASEPLLSQIEKEVLAVLCRVDKDETAAREMSMSIRTFRRYVADLMVRLGASNRFQAALLAKERGWL